MLRIHFTGRDLENVRLARRPDPLWEIVCSLCRLQNPEGALAFDPWKVYSLKTRNKYALSDFEGDGFFDNNQTAREQSPIGWSPVWSVRDC
ncbi:hypothetical protein [Streptomyces sp. NPDC059278]|uniref:hypothetical protein n=1 Tax=Streptomyces sp. NPDC059278 TaxID=3346801 RepID=UPI0036A33AFD